MTEIIDFHGHLFPPAVVERHPSAALASVAAVWDLLTDADAQLEQAAAAGTDVKVVNAPISSIADVSPHPRGELPERTNDALAAEVQRFGGRLVALATVDAYAGDAGADEARRAVDGLGFPGILVDVADGELLLSDPVARPTLSFAAERGVPVFAHPVNPPRLDERFLREAASGVLVARGTESALSTLSLLAAGIFDELPGLKLVNAGIGGAALLLARFLDRDRGANGEAGPSRGLRHLHIDTMGFDPKTIRFAVDTLGVDHVLVGSDWPIMPWAPSRERVTTALAEAGLDASEIASIASGNARRLLWSQESSDAVRSTALQI